MKIKKIYCNGCSHSAGGGLEIDRLLDDVVLVRDYYKQKYNVYWESQSEATYLKHTAEKLNCEYVNEAASGGGSERVVRMAYEFIKKNFKIKEIENKIIISNLKKLKKKYLNKKNFS